MADAYVRLYHDIVRMRGIFHVDAQEIVGGGCCVQDLEEVPLAGLDIDVQAQVGKFEGDIGTQPHPGDVVVEHPVSVGHS
ncbi:hypothetical protein ES703_118648 [subsurface metagenome]